MTQRQVWAAIGLIILVGGIGAYHAYNIAKSKQAIAAIDPSFVRITRTTNMYANCGKFESVENRIEFPNGEHFYWIGSHLYIERKIKAAQQAGDPVRGDPRCGGNKKGGWVAAIFDPLLLPIVGVADQARPD
jgi:hypothetical protein